MTGYARSVPDVRRERDRSRKRILPADDAQLLSEYRDALRAELRSVLAELRPPTEPGLFGPNVKRPPLSERVTLWALADRLARNLSGQPDLDDDVPPAPAPAPDHRRRRLGAVGD